MGAADGQGAVSGLCMTFWFWDRLKPAGLLIHGQMGGFLGSRGSHNAGDVVRIGIDLAIRLWC